MGRPPDRGRPIFCCERVCPHSSWEKRLDCGGGSAASEQAAADHHMAQTHVLVEALPLDASAPKLISAPQDAVIERGTTSC